MVDCIPGRPFHDKEWYLEANADELLRTLIEEGQVRNAQDHAPLRKLFAQCDRKTVAIAWELADQYQWPEFTNVDEELALDVPAAIARAVMLQQTDADPRTLPTDVWWWLRQWCHFGQDSYFDQSEPNP